MFTFLCKQNQHNELGWLIFEKYGIKPRMEPYNGPRGQGVLVSFQPPHGVSNRKVDQFLHSMGLPGSRSRRNKLKILNPNLLPWEIASMLGYGARFILPIKRKLVKCRLVNYGNGCTCCGPTPVIERAASP